MRDRCKRGRGAPGKALVDCRRLNISVPFEDGGNPPPSGGLCFREVRVSASTSLFMHEGTTALCGSAGPRCAGQGGRALPL
jgi:hypothetical protein